MLPIPVPAAERLLNVADNLTTRHVQVVLSDDVERTAALAALALKLKRNPSVALRAMVEDWTQDRIVKELY